MQKKSLIIFIYAVLVLGGGLIGYAVAGSIASIVASSAFATILFITGYLVSIGNKLAYDLTLFVILFLTAFFGYRFFLSYKMMPGGVMSLISALTFGYLIASRSIN